MKILVARHLKLFLKNPANIILSFLSSFVILSLYFLFIRDFTIKAVSDYGFMSEYNELFVDQLMTSGLLIVIGATSVLSVIFIFVKDHCTGTIKDFLVTPISYLKIIYSYFFAAFMISMIITLIVYFGIELFFYCYYDFYHSIEEILFSILLLISSNIIACLLILIVALGIHSFTSFSTFETLYGVVIGFFTGVYIPIGYYPSMIRNIFFYFPLCQTTSILRNIQTSSITKNILARFPISQHHVLYDTFGIHLTFQQQVISLEQQIWMIILAIILLNLILILLIKIKQYHKS